jgi:hypothetical protein
MPPEFKLDVIRHVLRSPVSREFFGGFALSWIHISGRRTDSFLFAFLPSLRLGDERRVSGGRWLPRRKYKTVTALLTLGKSGVADETTFRALHCALKTLQAAFNAF